jgi:VanZ family protein
VIDRGEIHSAGRWASFIAYLALTFFLSSRSHIPGAGEFPDYLLHAAEYCVLSVLLLRALSGGVLRTHSRRALAVSLAFGAGYGILDEVHQYFVPGRNSSVKDAAVDAAATALTVLVVSRLAARRSSPVVPARVEMMTRGGCHLCEEAAGVLTAVLGPEGQGWRAVDIDGNGELAVRYGREIPVVLVDGIKRFRGRVDPERLARILAERPRLRAGR